VSRKRLDLRDPVFLVFCLASGSDLRFMLGRDFFPSVDAGLIRLHMRAQAGSAWRRLPERCDRVDNLIRQVIPALGPGKHLDNIGLPNSTINHDLRQQRHVIGESDAEILIGLKPERKKSDAKHYIDELRGQLPEGLFRARNSFFSPRTSSARF
jgi:multidrug efflux pump subunit AcrB